MKAANETAMDCIRTSHAPKALFRDNMHLKIHRILAPNENIKQARLSGDACHIYRIIPHASSFR